MAENSVQRRLVAILAADVVGYSRLMGQDEDGTLAAVRNLRAEVIEPKIAEHQGRLFKTTGDGFLAEFPSVVNAVTCATAVQKAMSLRNADAPEDRRVELRIGIHLGDVIAEDGDVYGDGVNVAARIEGLASPGGVVISGMVHDNVGSRLDLAYEDLGEQQLKNIVRPIRVYRLVTASRTAVRTAQPAGTKPSIAVLPFTNISGDSEQEYFSDGITEDIITELSRFRNLLVIARNSSFTYKGQAVDVKKVGRELGVAYVLEGSVRRAGNRVRITAQLIDAETGSHLWAERYDRPLADVFAVQDELTRTVTSTVGGQVEEASKQRIRHLADTELRAYDLFLRAASLQDANTREAYSAAANHLKNAMALDATFAPAFHHLSLVRYVEWMAFWAEDRESTFQEALSTARQAVALDPSSNAAQAHFAMLLSYTGSYQQADFHFAKALQLNPNDSRSLALYGFFLTATGRFAEALEAFEQSAQLNPLQPGWTNWLKGIAYFSAERYHDAIVVWRSIARPMNEVRGWLAAAYGHVGELETAKEYLVSFLDHASQEMPAPPERTIVAWRPFWQGAIPYRDQKDFERIFAGLRLAGMSD